MSNFQIRGNKYYRLSSKGSKTINNNIITDALALEFLAINPDRIRLFEVYPSNWEDMLSEAPEVTEDNPEPTEVGNNPEEAIDEALVKELSKYKMQELRDMYPDITPSFGTTKAAYITDILKHQN